MLFVTNKDKNPGKVNHRTYLGSEDILEILESDIILYGLERYKTWYFDEIKTPFCDEFPTFMKTEFNIQLETE